MPFIEQWLNLIYDIVTTPGSNVVPACRKITDIALQHRVVRIIMNVKYDNTDNAKLPRQLNWLNVSQIIDFETASLTYKIENGLAPAHLKQMFVKSEDLHSYDTRSANSGNFDLPKRRLDIGQTAFSFHGAGLWNQLPYEIKKAQSLEFFQ